MFRKLLITLLILLANISLGKSDTTINDTSTTPEINEKPQDNPIFPGTKSKLGYFPAHVDIKDALTGKHKCSGTLIEDKHVVTTAFCVTRTIPKDLAVMAGDVTLLPNQVSTRETRRVLLIAQHPDYSEKDSEQWSYDIAILRVDIVFTRGNFLHPAVVPTKRVPVNTVCFLVGWGSGAITKDQDPSSFDLYYTDVYTKELEDCYKCVNNAICAGSNKTKACVGDNGGPLMCNGVLVGIYVGSVNNCQSLTGIYTDLTPYRQWIYSIINWNGRGSMPLPRSYARERSAVVFRGQFRSQSNKLRVSLNQRIYIIFALMIGKNAWMDCVVRLFL